MGFGEWLGAGASLVVILSGVAAGILFLVRTRRADIKAFRADLVGSWTNEGCINCDYTLTVDLTLHESEGFIIGEVSSSRRERPLQVHAILAWGSATLSVSEFIRNSILPIGRVKVTFGDSRRRLKWRLIGEDGCEYLPHKGELWPIGEKESAKNL